MSERQKRIGQIIFFHIVRGVNFQMSYLNLEDTREFLSTINNLQPMIVGKANC